MRLIALTDLHGDRTALELILAQAGDADVILLGGDITSFGTPNEAEDFIHIARRFCPQVLAVAGNCDSDAIDRRLSDLGVSLFGRGVIRDEIGFYGVSAMPPWTGTMYELSEDEIKSALTEGRQQIGSVTREIVLSHTPPCGTKLDLTRRGEHVGSTAVRCFIESAQPALVICGHIHEARGVDQLGVTQIVNCGPAYRGHFVTIEIDGEIEIAMQTAT